MIKFFPINYPDYFFQHLGGFKTLSNKKKNKIKYKFNETDHVILISNSYF